jgi:Tfp pilus assembly protein PilN
MTYSSTMALGRQRTVSRGQNSVTFRSADKRLGPVSNTIVLIVLACLLGLLYLTQVTKTNAYGYSINALQQQQSQLKNQHDDLAIASARLQSLDQVQNSPSTKNMTPVAPAGSVQ